MSDPGLNPQPQALFRVSGFMEGGRLDSGSCHQRFYALTLSSVGPVPGVIAKALAELDRSAATGALLPLRLQPDGSLRGIVPPAGAEPCP